MTSLFVVLPLALLLTLPYVLLLIALVRLGNTVAGFFKYIVIGGGICVLMASLLESLQIVLAYYLTTQEYANAVLYISYLQGGFRYVGFLLIAISILVIVQKWKKKLQATESRTLA